MKPPIVPVPYDLYRFLAENNFLPKDFTILPEEAYQIFLELPKEEQERYIEKKTF